METTTAKPNYRNFKFEIDKPFFAAYLNTAKQNVFIILRDICESIGLGFDLSDDDNMMNAGLWKYLQTNKEPEVTQRIIEKLEDQFLFTNFFVKNYTYFTKEERLPEPNDYFKVFELLIDQLYKYRNCYSHAVHDTVNIKKEIISGMRTLYDASWREIKERFHLKTEDVNHLVRSGLGGKEIDNFFYRFLDNEGNITEKGFAFFICLWLQRKDAQLFLKQLEGFKRSELPKYKATLETFTNFSARIPQPRLTSDNKYEGLLLDMVNELERCPKELYPLLCDSDREKFKAVEDDKTLGLEDEYEAMPILKRSSNRFFYFALRYLDNSFQNLKFHIDLGNYCFHVYDQIIEGTTRKRRWIKRMTAFGNLSDFVDDNRPTKWMEKIQKLEDRKIDNPDVYMTETTPHYHVNGQNIGIKFIHNYTELKRKNEIWPELKDFELANKKETKPNNDAPDCWLSLYELPAIVFYHLLQQQTTGLFSAEKIINDHRKQIKDFFKDIENNILKPGITNETLIKELEKRGLEKSWIPKAIIKYLISKPVISIDTKAIKRLEELEQETHKKLSKVERQKGHYSEKPGSKDYVEMKAGQMADFMARDMIRLQKPIDGINGKPNGTEFQVLQAKLAFFGKNKDSLKDIFKLCNLVESKNPHPFLNEINVSACNGILEFYIQYLTLREKYLTKCIKDKNFNEYHFLKLGEKSKETGPAYITKLAGKLQKDTVMNLPRGLFLKPILNALKVNEITKALASEMEKMPRVNVSYIIEKYLILVRNDQPQEFYTYGKSYDLLNKLYDSRTNKRNALEKKYFDTNKLTQMVTKINDSDDNEITKRLKLKIEAHIKKERISIKEERQRVEENYWTKYDDFTENEKQIRLAKTCDLVLFMIADDIFRNNFVADNGLLTKKTEPKLQTAIEIGKGYKLSEIKPNSDKGFLSLQTNVKLEMPYSYETNLDKLLKVKDSKSIKSSQSKTIVKEIIKIKNYGDFRGLLKDRRISSLLPYIRVNEIYFEALQKELELYHDARLQVFEKIFEFEKAVLSKTNIPKNDKGYIEHTEILRQKVKNDLSKLNTILQLRNAFSHSNYPEYILFKDVIDGSQFNELKEFKSGDDVSKKSIVLQFKDLIINYYDEFITI